MIFHWMMKKPKNVMNISGKNYRILVSCLLILFTANYAVSNTDSGSAETMEDLECFKDDEKKSIWESNPIEIDNVNIQILDKISGKVFRKNIKAGDPIIFGSIKLNLKRCFKSSPEDYREIYSFIEIYENNKMVFAKWLFASSSSINLFSHAIYDARIEF